MAFKRLVLEVFLNVWLIEWNEKRKFLRYCNVGHEHFHTSLGMQCTTCRFCCSSRQSKVSRWHSFNFYAFIRSRFRFASGDLELRRPGRHRNQSYAWGLYSVRPPFYFRTFRRYDV